MTKARAIFRLISIVLLTCGYLTPVVWRWLLGSHDQNLALEKRRRWAVRALKLLGVKVTASGLPAPTGTFVYMGNHRSYLDPVIVLTQVHAWPVAKAEMASWPIFGFGAKLTGVLFVKREQRDSRAAALQAIQELLYSGQSVLVYPEGTTHLLPQTISFRPGSFRLAAANHIPVVPIAIDYEDPSDAWVGSDTFLPHFLRSFGKKQTRATIAFGQPISDDDAAVLQQNVRHWIDQQLQNWHSM